MRLHANVDALYTKKHGLNLLSPRPTVRETNLP